MKKGHLFLYILLLLSSPFTMSDPSYALVNEGKIKLSILPFNSLSSQTIDYTIPAVLRAELANYGFINLVPSKLILKTLNNIEPSILWTGRKGTEDSGGILWNIEPRMVVEINRNISADFSVFGNLIRFGKKWRIDAYIIEGNDLGPKGSFSSTGIREEDIPDGIREIAIAIVNWLKRKKAIEEAEGYIRDYLGRLYTYDITLDKIKRLNDDFPDYLPIKALMLDLYLKEKERNQDKVLMTALRIINIYNPSYNEDTRYLLSINLDPFDIAAKAFEEDRQWEKAIAIREKALKLFPYKITHHRKKLGKDHYLFALFLEKKEKLEQAIEHYTKVLDYLPSSSSEFTSARERIKQLSGLSR